LEVKGAIFIGMAVVAIISYFTGMLKVEKVGTITVTPPTVTAVNFALTAGGLPGSSTLFGRYSGPVAATAYDGRFNGKSETNHNTYNVTTNDYIATWQANAKDTVFQYLDVNVTIANTRAFMVDEGHFAGGDNFYFKDGTIRLKNSSALGRRFFYLEKLFLNRNS